MATTGTVPTAKKQRVQLGADDAPILHQYSRVCYRLSSGRGGVVARTKLLKPSAKRVDLGFTQERLDEVHLARHGRGWVYELRSQLSILVASWVGA